MNTPTLLARIASGRTDLVHEDPALLVREPVSTFDGASALQWCAYYGDASALRTLLAQGATLSQLGEDLGLNAAAFHGHWQLCQFLLENGADARRADRETGETPLHSALTNEDRARYDLVVRVLLAFGADPNAATLAARSTGSFMRDCRTRGETPLHRAAAFGEPITVQLLLEAGADPERLDAAGDSPLGWASWYRRPPEVLRLLTFGAHRIHPESQSLRVSLLGQPLSSEENG